MEKELIRLCDEYTEKTKMVREAFPLSERVYVGEAACLLLEHETTLDELKKSKEFIRSKASYFSSFRGPMMPIVCTAMAIEGNKEEEYDKLISVSRILKKDFGLSEYLSLLALDASMDESITDMEEYSSGLKKLYNAIKAKYHFITSSEDYNPLSLLYKAGITSEKVLADLDECFALLAKQSITRNNIQAVGFVFSLSSRPLKEQCDKLLDMLALLKERHLGLLKENFIATLALLSTLEMNNKDIIDELLFIEKLLMEKHEFNSWAVSKIERISLAASLLLKYHERPTNPNINSIISLRHQITLTIALLACSIASVNAAVNSSSH